MLARENSLFRNPDPQIRATYIAHLWVFALTAPFNALVAYAPFLAVKTFHARAWAPALTAIIQASHLLGVFFNQAIGRSNKTSWVVRPLIISNLIFVSLLFVRRDSGWVFAVVIILALLLRAPIIAAQSAIFRTNYPPKLRSTGLAVPMGIQMAINAFFSLGAGMAFDLSEDWVVPYFLIAAAAGIVGALAFKDVRPMASAPAPPAAEEPGYLASIARQFGGLMKNPGFFRYQASYVFFGSGTIAVAAILPFYLSEEFHASHQQASAAINFDQNLAIALTLPLWGWLLDRHNPLVMRAVTTGLWAFQPLLLYWASSLGGVHAAQILQGFVNSGGTLIWWLGVNYFARQDEVANLMSLHQTLTGMRGILVPYIGIAIGNWVGYRNSMLVWFVMMVIGFWIMVDEVLREKRQGKLRSFHENEAILDRAEPSATLRIAKEAVRSERE